MNSWRNKGAFQIHRTEDECCGTCRHHRKDARDWGCYNEDSERCGEYTGYKEWCEEYAERERKKP